MLINLDIKDKQFIEPSTEWKLHNSATDNVDSY